MPFQYPYKYTVCLQKSRIMFKALLNKCYARKGPIDDGSKGLGGDLKLALLDHLCPLALGSNYK